MVSIKNYILLTAFIGASPMFCMGNLNLVSKLDTNSQKTDGPVIFSPDNKRLVTTNSNVAQVWDVQTKKLIFTLQGHKDPIAVLAYSPNGKFIATGSQKSKQLSNNNVTNSKKHITVLESLGTLKIWNAETGKCFITVCKLWDIYSIDFSTDTKYMAVCCEQYGSKPNIFSLTRYFNNFDYLPFFNEKRYNPSKEYILFTGYYEVDEGIKDGLFGFQGSSVGINFLFLGLPELYPNFQSMMPLVGHANIVDTMIWSPNGEVIITNSKRDHMIKIWKWDPCDDVNCNKTWFYNVVKDFDISPDNKNLAIITDNGLIKVVDIESGNCISTLNNTESSSIKYSPDGKQLVMGCKGYLKFWHLEKGDEVHNFKINNDSSIPKFDFSKNGKFLVIGAKIFDNPWYKNLQKRNLIINLKRKDFIDIKFNLNN